MPKGIKGFEKGNKWRFKKGQLAPNWNGFKRGIYQGYGFKKGNHPSTEFKKGCIKSKNAYTWESGKRHPFWKDGITPINIKVRTSLEYKLWRKAIFERDNWTCIWCGKRGVELHVDHIKSFALYPELRFAIDNGRTLCKRCHKKTKTYGWKIMHSNKQRTIALVVDE